MIVQVGQYLVVMLLIASCSMGRSGRSDEAFDVNPLGSLGIDLAEQDPFVQEVLADGMVTTAELEAAILAVVACMGEEGLVVEVVITDVDKGEYHLGYGAGPTERDLEGALAIERICNERFLIAVANAYSRQIAPSQDEFLRQYGELARCLEERGIEVAGPTPEGVTDAVFSHPEDYADCSEQVGL